MISVITIGDFTNANNLISGFRRVEKVSGWKESTQHFKVNLLRNINKIQKSLRTDSYNQDKGSQFQLNERGHVRLIKALTVKDMVVHHSLTDTVLNPILKKYIIHDNGASLKGKGISFTRKRFEQHLKWHYDRYGTEGYALVIDFTKYFDNMKHDTLRKEVYKRINNKLVINVLEKILKANEIDISFTSDPNYIDKVFNSLEYVKISKVLLNGSRLMQKSLGIGSPISQILGIYLPTRIDNYCKTVKSIHCYDVYMDDRIIIHPSKEYLKQLLIDIQNITNELGIHINNHKTQIIKLSHGITFLKTKYILTHTGKIIRKIPRSVLVRQKRKMKKLAKFVINRAITYQYFCNQYWSWRGDKRRYDIKKSLINTDELFSKLKDYIMINNAA